MSDDAKQLKWDKTFLMMAKILAEQSHCVSRHVGAFFVRDGRILVSGINGTIKGETNCDEVFVGETWNMKDHREWSDKNELHAEQNGIIYAAKHGVSLDGSTVYSTLQPCDHCIKMIAAVGVKRVVFSQYYDRVGDGTSEVEARLNKLGIAYERIEV